MDDEIQFLIDCAGEAFLRGDEVGALTFASDCAVQISAARRITGVPDLYEDRYKIVVGIMMNSIMLGMVEDLEPTQCPN